MIRSLIPCIGFLVFLTGCGPKSSTIAGSARYNGKPLAEARIILVPDEWDGPTFAGKTDGAGEFLIKATHGKYKVTVFKRAPGPSPMASETPNVYMHAVSTPFSCDVPSPSPLILELVTNPPIPAHSIPKDSPPKDKSAD